MSDYDDSVTIGTESEHKWFVVGSRSFNWFRSIPERRQDASNYSTWVCAATDTTQSVILKNIGNAKILFSDEDAELSWKYLRLRDTSYDIVRDSAAVYKSSKRIPDRCNSELIDSRAADYQKLAGSNSAVVEGYAFFMEQGTGKTLSAIVSMSKLPKGSMVLIVCPKQVRLNWQREIKEFCKVETHVEVVRGSQIDRISALIDAKRASRTAHLSVAVMGYDSIPGTWEALKLMKWSLCVADESHFFKSHSTKRWSFMEKLRETCDKRIACTGTPIANSINDLWTQLEWLCKGASGFNSFAAFKQHFGVYDRRGDGSFERFLGLQNVPIIKDRLSKYSFSITKKEAMPSLPDKLYDVVEVEMTEDQMLAYEKMKTALQFEIEGVMNSDLNPSVQVNNILTMLMKLAQITSGFIKTPDVKDAMGDVIAKGTIITFSPNPKVEALSEILLAKGKYDKTLVWAHFKHDIQKIKLMCDTIGIKAVTFDGGTSDDNRAEAERAFNNDDDCKVFIGNPGAGGTGLNLLGFPPQDPSASQCNANHTIYFSQDWSSLKRSQSEDRNHRRGVRTCIQVTDLCIANTIDEQIRERVASKRLNALEITDVRDLLKNIFNTKLK